jgi:TorA maturation chaperone TorD
MGMVCQMHELNDQADDAAPARRVIYEFLAGCFMNPPTRRQMDVIRTAEIQSLCAILYGHETPVSPATSVHDRESDSSLNREFMDLLKVPGAKYLAPYESVYRDSREIEGQPVRGMLMGQSAIDVQKWYRLAALDIDEACKELPDHVGLELAYVAHLCRKELEFRAAGNKASLCRAKEMQRDFLAAHLAPWMKSLRDSLYQKSVSAHFRAVADMAADLVASDLAALEQELGPSSRSSAPPYATAPGEG